MIYWDRGMNVFGASITSSGDGVLSLLKVACSDPGIPDLAGRLVNVFNRLEIGENHKIVLAARFDGAICMELELPKLPHHEMRKALDFELPRHIPVPIDEVIWTFRTVSEGGAGKGAAQSKVRILSVSRKVWDTTISSVAASGIKADVMTHPVMALRNLPSDPEELLDNHDEMGKALSSLSGSDAGPGKFAGLDVISGLPDEQKTGLLVCLLVGEFILQENVSSENLNLSHLPDSMRPQRFRAIRYSAAALFMLVLVLAGTLIFRSWLDARDRYGKIIAEKQRTLAKIDEFKQERLRNKKTDELVKKIRDSNPGNPEVILCLQLLSQKLPSNMWITMFNSRDNEMDVTICTMKDKDAQADLSKLSSLPNFSSFSIRSTRRDGDGTLTIFVHIVYQDKLKRQKNG